MRSEAGPAPGLLLEQVLAAHYPERVSTRVGTRIVWPGELWCLGSEVYRVIEKRFREQRLDVDHARDAYQEVLLAAVDFLRRYGRQAVRDLRAWLHAITRNATSKVIAGLLGRPFRPYPVVWLEDLLCGDGEYDVPPAAQLDLSDDDIERLFFVAIDSLHGRSRELAWRRFIELESQAQIMVEMKIGSDRAYRRLNAKTTKLLRAAVIEQLACVTAGSVA